MPHVRLGALKPEHHCHHCGAKMPHLHHDLCVHPAAPTGQGQANDSSIPRDNGSGVRGAGSQPRAPRVSLHLGALVLFCGPADRERFSVLNSVAGAVSTTISLAH